MIKGVDTVNYEDAFIFEFIVCCFILIHFIY